MPISWFHFPFYANHPIRVTVEELSWVVFLSTNRLSTDKSLVCLRLQQCLRRHHLLKDGPWRWRICPHWGEYCPEIPESIAPDVLDHDCLSPVDDTAAARNTLLVYFFVRAFDTAAFSVFPSTVEIFCHIAWESLTILAFEVFVRLGCCLQKSVCAGLSQHLNWSWQNQDGFHHFAPNSGRTRGNKTQARIEDIYDNWTSRKNSPSGQRWHKYPEKLGNLHPSKCSELTCIRTWATWSYLGISPLGSRELGERHPEFPSHWNLSESVKFLQHSMKSCAVWSSRKSQLQGPRQRSLHVHPFPWWFSFHSSHPDVLCISVMCWQSSSRSPSHSTALSHFTFWLNCQIPQTVSPYGSTVKWGWRKCYCHSVTMIPSASFLVLDVCHCYHDANPLWRLHACFCYRWVSILYCSIYVQVDSVREMLHTYPVGFF